MVPLLVACGSEAPGGNISTTLSLPEGCAGDEALSAQNGQFICKKLPGNIFSLPKCGPLEALTSDGKGVTCVAKDEGGSGRDISTELTEIDRKLTEFQTSVNTLKGRGGGISTWVGNTTATSTGKFVMAGKQTGIDAANGICNAEFSGSHWCDAYEIYSSVNAGKFKFDGTTPPNGQRAWIFMPTWSAPGTGVAAQNPAEGTADTCGSGLYDTADLGWNGVAFEWASMTVKGVSSYGLKFHGGANGRCNEMRKLACCK